MNYRNTPQNKVLTISKIYLFSYLLVNWFYLMFNTAFRNELCTHPVGGHADLLVMGNWDKAALYSQLLFDRKEDDSSQMGVEPSY